MKKENEVIYQYKRNVLSSQKKKRSSNISLKRKATGQNPRGCDRTEAVPEEQQKYHKQLTDSKVLKEMRKLTFRLIYFYPFNHVKQNRFIMQRCQRRADKGRWEIHLYRWKGHCKTDVCLLETMENSYKICDLMAVGTKFFLIEIALTIFLGTLLCHVWGSCPFDILWYTFLDF